MNLPAEPDAAQASASFNKASVHKMIRPQPTIRKNGVGDGESSAREVSLVVCREDGGPRNLVSVGHFLEQRESVSGETTLAVCIQESVGQRAVTVKAVLEQLGMKRLGDIRSVAPCTLLEQAKIARDKHSPPLFSRSRHSYFCHFDFGMRAARVL